MAVILKVGYGPKWRGKFHLVMFGPADAARVQAG